jgi:acetolactate synthase I/II/III large subunit
MPAALYIGGPGLANTVTAVAAAQSDGSPVLLMSGEVSTLVEGLGMFQDASPQTLDDVEIVKPIVRHSSSIDNPRNLPHLFKHAMLWLRTQSTGPVHLSLPQALPASCRSATRDWSPISPILPRFPLKLAESPLRHFIGSAKEKAPAKIVILAGAGVEPANASQPLQQFAELWQIPVATTLRAKGVFPEDHPLSLGVFGYAGTHHSTTALLDAPPDLLIVLGSGLNERDTMHWALQLEPNTTVCVNLAPVSIGTHTQSGGVIGDCGAYPTYLLSRSDKLRPALQQTVTEAPYGSILTESQIL